MLPCGSGVGMGDEENEEWQLVGLKKAWGQKKRKGILYFYGTEGKKISWSCELVQEF